MSESIMRIVILGKTGSGKSSLANTIFGEKVFNVDETPSSGTIRCEAKTTTFNGKTIMLVDTPGLFDSNRPEEMEREIMSCLAACAPGPHAFFILLKVEKYTPQEKAVIAKMQQYFPGVLDYSIVVFTHGDQLQDEEEIENFVAQNEGLRDLVEKCGGRYHVVDNKYWESNQGNVYRYNVEQLKKILETTEKMIEAKKGKHYTNEPKSIISFIVVGALVVLGGFLMLKYRK